MQKIIYIALICFCTFTHAQQPLTAEMLEASAIRFTLTTNHQLPDDAKAQWLQWIGDSQFVGIAEVHNSAQLSAFTKALLPVLAEKDFTHFAMEMGPTTADILETSVSNSDNPTETIRLLNRKYGKNSQFDTPLIFVNKKEDALFVEEASRLGFSFWGIDQEFACSYEMLIDHLYANYGGKSSAFEESYQMAKSAIRKVIFKNKYKGQTAYNWFLNDEDIADFFEYFTDDPERKIIQDMKISWDIYHKSATGQGSNQQRADYMKSNFENNLDQYGLDSKVLVKLGGIHLTHGLSHFRVDDMGKYLTEKAAANGTEFINIRHLITYRNGKSNIGKSSWKNTQLFLELGRKEQWTAVDLRPFREKLKSGEITTESQYAFELMSYDLLLISPDDQYPKVNY